MFKIVYDYKKVDLDLLRMDFVVVLWSICNVFDNLDDVIWVWEYLYKDIMKFYFYVWWVKIRRGGLFWMNFFICKELNKCYKLFFKV